MSTEFRNYNRSQTFCRGLVRRHTEHLKNYLRGFGNPSREDLLLLVVYSGWQAAAEKELIRRCEALLPCLDDQTLVLLATGDLAMQSVATDVAQELGVL